MQVKKFCLDAVSVALFGRLRYKIYCKCYIGEILGPFAPRSLVAQLALLRLDESQSS
jgi:hypothetical protein